MENKHDHDSDDDWDKSDIGRRPGAAQERPGSAFWGVSSLTIGVSLSAIALWLFVSKKTIHNDAVFIIFGGWIGAGMGLCLGLMGLLKRKLIGFTILGIVLNGLYFLTPVILICILISRGGLGFPEGG